MIRKFVRHLLLRCLILAFTGDKAAEVLDAEAPKQPYSVAAVALRALDSQVEAGWQLVLLPVTAYELIRGTGL